MSEYSSPIQKVFRLPTKVISHVRRRGLFKTIGWCWYQWSWRYREWRLGIDTAEFSHGFLLQDEGECNGYEPVDYKCFDEIVASINVRPGQDVLLDYGCGKGRAVVLAALRPFARVIGIERSPQLVEIAQENVRSSQRKLNCANVEIVEVDACEYAVPADVSAIFLFNSFRGEVLDRVLQRIRQSLEKTPRDLQLVYMIPKDQDDPLQAHPWLERINQLPTGYWEHVTCWLYRGVPRVEAAR